MIRRPALTLVSAWVLGQLAGRYATHMAAKMFLAIPVCFCCLFLLYRRRFLSHKRKSLLMAGLLLLVLFSGFCRMQGAWFAHEKETEVLSGGQVVCSGQIYRREQQEDSIRIFMKDVCFEEPEQINTDMDIILEFSGEGIMTQADLIKPGQRVRASGGWYQYEAPTNYGQFHVADYYRCFDLGGRLLVDQVMVTDPHYGIWQNLLWNLRQYLSDQLSDLVSGRDLEIMRAVLLGERGQLSDETQEMYQNGGIAHLLCVSGLHISLLGMGMYRLLRRLLGQILPCGLLAGGIMVSYGMMLGESASVVRAITVFLLMLLADILGRTPDLLSSTALAALLLLAESPWYLFQSGFQMSFLAIGGIGIFYPVLTRFTGAKSSLKKTLLSGLSIQIFTMPAVAWHQFCYPVYGIFLNLITIPLMGLVLICGFTGLVLAQFWDILGIFVLGPAHYVLDWYQWCCEQTARLPGNQFLIGRPLPGQLAAVVVVAGIVFGLMSVWGKKREVKFSSPIRFFSCLLILPVVVLALIRPAPESMTVTWLDVGQGDGIVFQLPGGEVLCMDGGSSSQRKLGEYVMEPWIQANGISRVHYWFLTHPDEDHYSGLLYLLESGFAVDYVVLPEVFARNELCRKLEQYSELVYVKAGDRFQSGEFCAEVLYPSQETMVQDTNNGSLVLYVTCRDFAGLFTGDLESGADSSVIDALGGRKAQVLKVAHHGSSGATSMELLQAVDPQIAVISYGKNNRYGHPHKELLERLQENGCVIYNTAQMGMIQLRLLNKGYGVTTMK